MKAVFVLCLVLGLVFGDEIKLTMKNFDSIVVESEEAFMIKFSSKMCGSCKEFEPEWESLTKSLKRIKTAHISIDNEDGRKIAEKLGVLDAGIPFVQLYTTEKPQTVLAGEVKTSKFLRKMIAPLVKGLQKRGDGVFVKKGKGEAAAEIEPDADGIYHLTDANWDAAIAKNHYYVKFFAPWCSMCTKLAPFFNKIPAAIKDKDVVRIAKIDATTEMIIANKYKISKYPTLKVIGISKKSNEEIAVDFNIKSLKSGGESESMAKYAEKKAADLDKAYESQQATIKFEKEQAEAAVKSQEDEAANNDINVVKRITPSNFKELREKYTKEADQTFFVKFYRPDCATCQKLAPRFKAAAEHLNIDENKKEIVFATADCVVFEQVCKDEGIPSYPLMLYYNKENMAGEWPGEQYGKISSVKGMVEFFGGDKSKISADKLKFDEEIDAEAARLQVEKDRKEAKEGKKKEGDDESDEL